MPDVTFLGEFFYDTKGSIFRFLGYLELVQNHMKPKGLPFDFFWRKPDLTQTGCNESRM